MVHHSHIDQDFMLVFVKISSFKNSKPKNREVQVLFSIKFGVKFYGKEFATP
jgi:hypothetical protein